MSRIRIAPLHAEIVAEILLRLPVKSLCRFKCVCKSWCVLISDPKFARKHLNLTITDRSIEHQRKKLILNSSSFSSMYYVQFESIACHDHVNAVKLDFPLAGMTLHDEIKLMGSFNGLLCIYLKPSERLFLFNPSIKELKKLPNLPIGKLPSSHRYSSLTSVYGFGYDHSIDDYKVVRIVGENIVYVYSLKTDTWRRVRSFIYHIFSSDPGVALNGAVHWVFLRGSQNSNNDSIEARERVMVAFDFVDEKFREISLPISNDTNRQNLARVGVLGGCLCWLSRGDAWPGSATQILYDFWVMKEYGVRESWTKVVIDIPFLCLKPLNFLKNDEALLEIDGKLVLYDPRDSRRYREVVIRGIHGRRRLEMETYVESLVSPCLWQWELEEICSQDA